MSDYRNLGRRLLKLFEPVEIGVKGNFRLSAAEKVVVLRENQSIVVAGVGDD